MVFFPSEKFRSLPKHPNRYFHERQEVLTPEFVKDIFQKILAKIGSAQDLAAWEEALFFWNEVKSHLETHFGLIQLAFQRFTEDPAIEAEEKRLREQIEPVCTLHNAQVRERFLGSPFRRDLEARHGSQYFLQLQIQQDAYDPKNIEIETQLNQVMADYTKLSGSAFFEVDGQKYPLAHIRKFLVSPDEGLRRRSYQSYSGWFLQNKLELNAIYDRAIDFRAQMAKTLGYENFIPLAYQKMRRVDYGPDEVAALREQIHEVMVPIATKIRAWQAKSLYGGGATRVKAWDADYFPQWQLGELKVSLDGQIPAALEVYRKLSPRLAQHFQAMINAELIDQPARQGKAPGAFCTGFDDYRVPYIFLNSVGEASDITTMLHESGHAFQAWESRDIDLLELTYPTLEACEVHSMGMEFLASPYYEDFFHPEDAKLYRVRHLAESILILPYIAMVDEFQHLVYRGNSVNAAARERIWNELEDKYNPGIDFTGLEHWRANRWIRQLHIFQVPFYYIDYAIAQVGAWQLWVQSLEDKEKAMENYLQLCKLGGTKALKDFFKAGHLRLPFEKGMLRELMDKVLSIEPIV